MLSGEIHALQIHGGSSPALSWLDTDILEIKTLLGKLNISHWIGEKFNPTAALVNDTDTLSALAVRRQDGWAVALVSASASPRTVNVLLPKGEVAAPRRQIRLEAATPGSSNEDDESVRAVETPIPSNTPLSVTVPAWGLLVLSP